MRNYVREQEHDDIRITDLYWDRIYLHIRLEGTALEDQQFIMASNKNKFSYPMDFDPKTREIVVNITNIGHEQMLSNGKWYLKYKNTHYDEDKLHYNEDMEEYRRIADSTHSEADLPEKPWPPFVWKNIPLTLEACYKLHDLDKVFRYTGVSYAYVLSFAPETRRDALICSMETTFMVKNKTPQKRYFKIEAGNRSNAFKRWFVYRLHLFLNGYYHFCARLHPKKGNRVLLMSETRNMGGNLQALDERIKARGLDKQFKLSYFFVKTPDISRKKVFFTWLKLARLAAKQDYIFVDDYVPFFDYVTPVEKTTLTQVWHAGVGYKSVGFARFGEKGSPRPFSACHRRYDYAVVGGEALRDVYAEVFGIDRSRCLPFGLMRNDGYMDPQKISAFRTKFYAEHPEFVGKKIIMFAPTFRGTGQKQANYPFELLEQDKIYEMCGDEYIFMIKMHPFIRDKMPISSAYADRIVDYSSYPDINELFYVTEILITDYSSNIYEFSMHRKPIISFAYDKDEYELIRSVHRPLDQYAPGKVCTTLDEVIDTIKNKDFEMDRLEAFVTGNVDESDGNAADRVIDYILLHQPMPVLSTSQVTLEPPKAASAVEKILQSHPGEIVQTARMTLAEGSTITVAHGSRVSPAAGSVVRLPEGYELTLKKGTKIVLADGSTVDLSGRSVVQMARELAQEAAGELPEASQPDQLPQGGEAFQQVFTQAFTEAFQTAFRSVFQADK